MCKRIKLYSPQKSLNHCQNNIQNWGYGKISKTTNLILDEIYLKILNLAKQKIKNSDFRINFRKNLQNINLFKLYCLDLILNFPKFLYNFGLLKSCLKKSTNKI